MFMQYVQAAFNVFTGVLDALAEDQLPMIVPDLLRNRQFPLHEIVIYGRGAPQIVSVLCR